MALKEVNLIFVEVGKNNNKYWDCVLNEDDSVVSSWGRVGETPKVTPLGFGEHLFNKRKAEKLKKGYTERETIQVNSTKNVANQTLAKAAKAQIRSDDTTAKLIDFLIEKNIHNILSKTTITYTDGVFKTPLGVVTQQGLNQARGLLKTISDCVGKSEWEADEIRESTNKYFRIIPKDFGRSVPSVKYLWPDDKAIQSQESILDSLEASLATVTDKPIEVDGEIPKLFEAELKFNEGMILEVQTLFDKSKLQMHYNCQNMRVDKVYDISIDVMNAEFENVSTNIGNIQRKWHGSKCGNLLSILKKGFVISSYAPNGRAFGNGIYFSSVSTKSLNYAVEGDKAFMFLCDVAVGKSYTPVGYDRDLPKAGYDSTWAYPNQTSYIQNDELIVYKTNQIKPVYLIEFERK